MEEAENVDPSYRRGPARLVRCRGRRTPAVSPARRTVSRPTRFRWLTGSPDTNEVWDAYESAEGELLQSASRRPRSWVIVRGWLQDLAQETAVSGEDGHLPDSSGRASDLRMPATIGTPGGFVERGRGA
jgi:hypothetical protein